MKFFSGPLKDSPALCTFKKLVRQRCSLEGVGKLVSPRFAYECEGISISLCNAANAKRKNSICCVSRSS